MPIKCLIILDDCSAIRFAKSLIVISSGMLTSLFTFFEFSSSFVFLFSLSSFSLALFIEAKLLDLNSISSLKALETVSFSSLFFVENLFLLSLSLASPFMFFVALCSASFLLS